MFNIYIAIEYNVLPIFKKKNASLHRGCHVEVLLKTFFFTAHVRGTVFQRMSNL